MKDLVVVKKFLNRAEAEVAKGFLKSRGIESAVLSDDCGGLRPEITLASGGINLLVRKEDLTKAKGILNNG